MVQDVVELLSQLIKIPSVCGQEGRLAHYIADWLSKQGIQAQLMDVKPGRPNVVATLAGAQGGSGLMFNGHMDTVDPGQGWTRDPFGAEIVDGRMYGRGSYDMKSGLAGILWAAAKCKEEGLPERGRLVVAAVVDEEAYDLGTYALVQHGLTGGLDFAVVAEATHLEAVTAHFGRAVFEVEVHGKVAHSQDPSLGVNAIQEAARLINALPRIRAPRHKRFGPPTVNALKIEGGQERLMLVPDSCRLLVERCLMPGYDSNMALKDLKALIKKTGVKAKASPVARETPFCDPFEIPDGNPHVRLVREAARRVVGKTPKISFHSGPCDSCILANQGKLPTIDFGPKGRNLHQPDEYVEIESVRAAANVYYEIAKAALS